MDCQSFYKADLHVHTPASSCYVSKKSNGDVDEEYFSILAQAVKKDIKVIAITDHNTIKGYRHICQLKHDVEQLYEEYNSSGRPIPQHLRRKASLFSKLTILPGVELEVAYSLHIIVIFHENVDSDNIHSFIEAAGYRAAEMGLEQSKIIPEWDIFRLFKEASKQECLIIDGHTDAAKGIWNEMKGSTRVRILKDPTLAGLCYKNDGQREQIEAVYRQADYKRAVPIAFIKASDAHKSDDVGSSCTWFKLEHFNFSCLKEAFNNPAEFIFTEEPTASKVIAGLLKTENTLLLKEINPETLTQFVRHICAFSNSNGGTILFGASSEKRITGIEIPQGKELNNLKEPLLNIIDNDFKNLPKPRVRFSMHCVRDNRYAISIRVLKSNPLLCTAEDSQIYYFENNKIRVLKAFEIQRLIEEQTLGSISSSIKNDLDEIQHRCNIVENSLLAWLT
jgi:hypothetical protein